MTLSWEEIFYRDWETICGIGRFFPQGRLLSLLPIDLFSDYTERLSVTRYAVRGSPWKSSRSRIAKKASPLPLPRRSLRKSPCAGPRGRWGLSPWEVVLSVIWPVLWRRSIAEVFRMSMSRQLFLHRLILLLSGKLP